jgi:hypothetical protein
MRNWLSSTTSPIVGSDEVTWFSFCSIVKLLLLWPLNEKI